MIYDFQKASFLKRISAFLLDFILIVIIGTFFAFLVSLITNYTQYVNEFQGYYTQYEATFGISLTSQEAFNNFTEEELEIYRAATEAMNKDDAVLRCWGLVSSLPIVMVSLGIFFSTLIVEFIIPLCLKNGQTVGKKIFNIAVIRVDGVKASHFQLFARGILGKCAIEMMIPGIIITMILFNSIGVVGPIIIFILLVAQVIVFLRDENRPFLHDLIAATGVCDKATQLIFNTREEMVAYKEKVNAEKANAASY